MTGEATAQTKTRSTLSLTAKDSAKGKKRGVIKTVSDLPANIVKLVRAELVAGGSFEDAVDLVAESGEGKIKPEAVARYFRDDAKLQKERFTHQLQAARELKTVLGHKSKASPEADFAFAVLLEGLTGLNRHDRRTAPTKAMRILKDSTEERFKTAESRRQAAKLQLAVRESQQRVRQMQVKVETATFQLDRLKQLIDRQGKDKTLGPEILQQINEIYGIVTAPTPEHTAGENHHEQT